MSLPVPSAQTHLAHPKYRADIDGLRAIAVLSVVGFHAFPDWIKGGFIGVDIFFVISGFLIFSIIFSNLEHQSFSLVEFYRRRINRIFPALLTVMFASFVFGWYALLPDEYMQLSKHIVGGVAFVSNFILYQEVSYFDTAANTKPMLHLWSLAIEEQFYFFSPLLMAFAWKRNWNFLAITAVIAILSFAVNIYTINIDPAASFYLPIPRFWELMIGGILAYITLHRPHLLHEYKSIQSILGIIFVLVALLFLSSEKAFPGWWALLPTLGAFFLISAGQNAYFNKQVLSSKLLVWFGLISYPLYLWHWPLLTFAQILEDGAPSLDIRISAIFISIALAWITYTLVEKPIRFGGRGSVKAGVLIFLMAIVGCSGYWIYIRDGFKSRYNEADLALMGFDNKFSVWREMNGLAFKQFNGTGKKVLIIGDSFAADLINSIKASNYNKEVQLSSLIIRAGCGNLFVAKDFSAMIEENRRPACKSIYSYKNPRYIELINKADWILLASNWKSWEVQFLQESINNLSAITNGNIYILGSKKFGHLSNRELLRFTQSERRTIQVQADKSTIDLNNKIRLTVGADKYIDIQTLICGANNYCPIFDENAMRISFDDKHFTPAGARYLGSRLQQNKILREILE